MLSIDTIVQVSVSATQGAASPEAYDTGLILASKGSGSTIAAPKSYSAAADMLADGFTDSDDAYKAAVKYFAASPAPSRLAVVTYGSGAVPTAALTRAASEAVPFYGIFCCDESAATVKAIAAFVESMSGDHVYFYGVTGTPEQAASVSGLFAEMKTAGYRRSLGIYTVAALDAAAVMGTAMGLALHNRASAFSLCYKQVSGIQPAGLTESQAASLKNLNANVYVARGGTRLMLENGSVASGLRYDEVLYIDQIASSLQEAAVSLLADHAGKLPQTDETSAVFINRFSSILSGFTAMGVLATAVWRGTSAGRLSAGDVVENGYTLWADSYDTQTDADRAAHRAMPIHCALCLAGSVETLVLSIDVTI